MKPIKNTKILFLFALIITLIGCNRKAEIDKKLNPIFNMPEYKNEFKYSINKEGDYYNVIISGTTNNQNKISYLESSVNILLQNFDKTNITYNIELITPCDKWIGSYSGLRNGTFSGWPCEYSMKMTISKSNNGYLLSFIQTDCTNSSDGTIKYNGSCKDDHFNFKPQNNKYYEADVIIDENSIIFTYPHNGGQTIWTRN